MPFNGSGSYSAPANTFNPAVSGTTITAADWNAILADLETALTTCIAKDGQTTVTANLPMATYRHTGVSNGAALDQYATVDQVVDGQITHGGTNATGTDAYAVSLPVSPGAYSAGQVSTFITDVANTGACSINYNSIGTSNIKLMDGNDPYTGAIQAGGPVHLYYDGTNHILLNPYVNGLYDSNGLPVVKLSAIASAVNELTLANAATTGQPAIAATGTDTNVGIDILVKGVETVNVNNALKATNVASDVNEVTVTSAVTTAAPKISASGTDTNVNLNLEGKGTGVVTVNGIAVFDAPAFQAYRGADQSLTGSGVLAFDNEDFDTNSNFDNTTNYRFTPDVAGYYYVYVSAAFVHAGPPPSVHIRKNGTTAVSITTLLTLDYGSYVGSDIPLNMSTVVNMNGSTDYVDLYFTHNGANSQLAANSRFGAFFVRK